MKVSDFTFDLPEELIAQDPLEDRSSSRLLTLDKNTGEIGHDVFHNIVNYLKPGDCLVLNNTKVIPARLIGAKEETGGKVEVLLLKRKQDNVWETLVKPGKKARPGARISFGDGKLVGEVIDVVDEGNRLVKFEYEGIFEEVLDELGQMPLPPYITHQLKDKNRYQTVYAKYDGSAAAPTAGLHFTKELLQQIKDMGVNIAYVTLHVGLGTFRPVKVDDVICILNFIELKRKMQNLSMRQRRTVEELFLLEQQVQELWNLLQKKMELCMQRADGQISSFIQDTNLK